MQHELLHVQKVPVCLSVWRLEYIYIWVSLWAYRFSMLYLCLRSKPGFASMPVYLLVCFVFSMCIRLSVLCMACVYLFVTFEHVHDTCVFWLHLHVFRPDFSEQIALCIRFIHTAKPRCNITLNHILPSPQLGFFNILPTPHPSLQQPFYDLELPSVP